MEIKCHIIDKEAEHETFVQWWTGHGWTPVPLCILPKLGVCVVVDGVAAAAGWLYMDNSVGVAMMEWVVTNPANNPRVSFRAIEVLVGALKHQAHGFGYGVILTSAKQEALVRMYERCGFQRTDDTMTHLVITL